MRKIERRPLSDESLALLQQRTSSVAEADDPAAEARRLWGQKNNAAFDEIRATLREMAPGIERCMYCEDSEGTDIEHFHPKRHYPELAFTWTNYLLACSRCNSNYKRDRFPLDDDDEPLLVDPTREDPVEHIALAPSTGKLVDSTPKGKTSIEVFGLNRPTLARGRQNRWSSLVLALIPMYARARRAGQEQTMAALQRVIREEPFSSVLCQLIEIAGTEAAAEVVPRACLAALAACPEIAEWAD